MRIANHHSPVALLLIDVINRFDFPDAGPLLAQARAMAPRLARLKERCRRAGIPAIYVNDHFGQWRSDAQRLVEASLDAGSPGRTFVEQLAPDESDYFVLKPMHSAFFQTPLEILLQHLGATSLILTGVATDSCILCSAHDARMRNFKLHVPANCSAAGSRREHEWAIGHLGEIASIVPSPDLRLARLKKS